MSQWSRITVVAVAVVGLAAGCSDPPQVTVNEADPSAAVGPESLPNGITVSGEGEVMGAPDTLAVTYGVSLKRDSVDAAVNDAANAANAALEAAKAQGVAEADIQTRDYSITPEYRYEDDEPPILDGYRVTNTVIVKIRDLTKAGATIDAVAAAGGNDLVLQGVAFSLEDDGTALDGARDAAFADARAKAEQYAGLSDQALGEAQAISDVVVTPVPITYQGEAASYAADAARAPTPISPGEVSTTVTVQVRFTFAAQDDAGDDGGDAS